MTAVLVALLMMVPVTAHAQDSVTVAVPSDRDCGDFVSEQDAQGWYDAMEIITGQPDAHNLDADGDGQPCEGLQFAKVEDLGKGYLIRYELEVGEYECPTVGEPFSIDALRDQAVLAARDSIPYRDDTGVWPRWECVHTISQLVSR